jgi:antitoxin YefM
MINITEHSFLKDPSKAIERLKEEHQMIKVVSDERSFIVMDEEEWNNIYETIYLNSIKGYPESVIEASKEDIEDATASKDLDW